MSCNKSEVAKVCHVYDYDAHACAESIPVWKLEGKNGYFLLAKMAIDVDGAPRAYHPKDRRPPDNFTNALDWKANVSGDDLHGIQGQDAVGPNEGFYVSGTALENPAFPENDTRRWVDAERIPYVVLVSNFPRLADNHLNARKGDCAVVIRLETKEVTPAIWGDVGAAVGEASLKVAWNLGLDPTASHHPPKVTGYDGRNFVYIVFPGVHVAPPWEPEDIRQKAMAAFDAWGGIAQVTACFG